MRFPDGLERRSRPVRLPVLAAITLLATTNPAAARKHPVPLPCAEGRFDVLGAPLMDPHASDDAIVIDAGRLTVMSGCGTVPLTVRRTKAGRVLRARWKQCLAGGAVRLRASFTGDCDELQGQVMKPAKQRLAFRARRARPQQPPDPDPQPNPDPGSGTFQVITDRIFTHRGCTVSTCHGDAKSGGLDLRADAAYAALVNAPATGAPGAMRVVPGHAETSFLSRKLRGQLTSTEGSRMPLVGDQLPVLERDLVDIWINAGAPIDGTVPGAPVLDPGGYRPAAPPPVPEGGIQLLLDGPMLEPGKETEGCLWVPAPNASDLLIARTSVVSNPGTHHVVVWRYNAPGTPQVNVWRPGDVACLSGSQLGTTGLAGAGMGNGSNTSLPPGIASVLPGGGYFGLNAHYYNEFDVPIQVKVWFNFFPYEGTPEHLVQTITALDTTFTISVAPFTQKIKRGHFVNNTGKAMNLLAVGGHMHKRGLRFSAWQMDGTKIFDDYDWAHPVGHAYNPAYVLAAGQWIDYECLHDNGVTRPVRLDTSGHPATLTFGISAEDEMCILTGSFYTD